MLSMAVAEKDGFMRSRFTIYCLVIATMLCLDCRLGFTMIPQAPGQEQPTGDSGQNSEAPPKQDKDKKKDEKETAVTTLQVEVTDVDTSTPIVGASVYVRAEQEPRPFEREPKTDATGVVRITGVPRGKILVQVTADGWGNGGDNYTLNRSEETLKIKLKKEN
jgi:hypothetical protein